VMAACGQLATAGRATSKRRAKG